MTGRPLPPVSVLVASPDRNFLILARTVLRGAGHHVATTTVSAERVRGQVRLRAPQVLLLDADQATVAALRADPGSTGTTVVHVVEEPGQEPADAPPAVGKWAPGSEFLEAVQNAGRTRLRLVDR